jgi:hypothetical protein
MGFLIMKQEKVMLSVVAILIGLVVAGAAFFLYQNSKKIENSTSLTQNISPTPIPSNFYLLLNEPKEETVTNEKTIKVSGKTLATATIIITTSSTEEIVKPSSQGDFSTTIQLTDGLNYLRVQAIDQNGETQTVERVIGYTTEDF